MVGADGYPPQPHSLPIADIGLAKLNGGKVPRCGHPSEDILRSALRDKDETALAVLALVAGVLHRLKRGDFVN